MASLYPDESPLKRCKRCGAEKPLTEYTKHPTTKDRLQIYCRSCGKELSAQRYTAHRDEENANRRARHAAHRDEEIARFAVYRAEHRESLAAAKRVWRATHPDVARERSRRWNRANHHWYVGRRDRFNASRRIIRAANPELVRQKERDRRRRNPHIYRQRFMRYYARKRAATVGPVDYPAILARDGYVCYLCGNPVAPGDLHFEHVIPLSRGGAHAMDNIKVAHALCNLRKGSKLPTEL